VKGPRDEKGSKGSEGKCGGGGGRWCGEVCSNSSVVRRTKCCAVLCRVVLCSVVMLGAAHEPYHGAYEGKDS
jgi:hypothetical protein